MRAAGEKDVLTAMVINDPATVAELQELYPRYEQALVSNDVETLMSMFWASPYVARFGPTESLYGISEIEAFRKGRSPANLQRTIKRLDLVTFGTRLCQHHAGLRAGDRGPGHTRAAEPNLGPPSRGMAYCLRPRIASSLKNLPQNASKIGFPRGIYPCIFTCASRIRFQVIATNAILLGWTIHFKLCSTQSREIHPG